MYPCVRDVYCVILPVCVLLSLQHICHTAEGHVNNGQAPADGLIMHSSASGGHVQVLQDDGNSRCKPPVLVPGTTDTFHVSCMSGSISLSPGQVGHGYYTLTNPFPSTAVAIVTRAAQLVDADGSPVPISEMYVHHVVGNARIVSIAGSEMAGTHEALPLPEPYYIAANGSFFNQANWRKVELHLINLLGVPHESLQPCLECWCNHEKMTSFAGGTLCCSKNNCPTPRADEPPTPYFLQYNITYRDPKHIENFKQAHVIFLDVVGHGGLHQYNVPLEGPGAEHVQSYTAPIDEHCPQEKPFGLLRCTGHQHVGARCLELVDTESGQLICSSCPVFDGSTGGDGRLHVRMTTTVMTPIYRLKPGQRVTINSRYDSSLEHRGAMGHWYLTMTDWDPSCPKGPRSDSDYLVEMHNLWAIDSGPAEAAIADVESD